MSLSSPAQPVGTSPDSIESSPIPSSAVCRTLLMILQRRAMYIGRFIYWAIRHRSFKHVAWVLEYEGYTWN